MYGVVEIAWMVDNDLKMMTVVDLVFLGLISFGWFVSLTTQEFSTEGQILFEC